MEAEMKNVVTIGVSSLEDTKRRLSAAFRGEPQGNHISFVSMDLMWKTLSLKRAEIVHVMTGQGVMSIREVARRVARDVKGVHGDVTVLIKAGIVDRQDGGVIFPYDSVHVDFTWEKAA
jgi:predicted transcriptional regulator